MKLFEGAFRWAGGAIFVVALAFSAYTFVVVWSRDAEFDGAAIAIDALLFTTFAAHHSVFARDSVKRGIAQVVPDRLIRSTYVWIASLLLIAVCGFWRTIGGQIYDAGGWRAWLHAGVQVAGLALIVSAVRKIDALELAGIREHAGDEPLQITGPYRLVRHPIYLGWLLATFGAAHMTMDRLMFSAISAAYLVVAMPLEERALLRAFGETYARYRERVRWRVVPYIY
jgi:protein-S-isoprenylcysteine O-methyltransferase Ste14